MTAPRPIFADPGVDAAFRRDGVAVVTPAQRIVEAGTELVERLARPGHEGLHITTVDPDLGYRREVSEAVMALAGPLITSLLVDHEAFHGNFIILHPGAAGLATPHQDWTFVDERHHRSLLAWIPLVDVDEGSGALRVARGTQHLPLNVRPSPIPHPGYGDAGRGYQTSQMELVAARAGDIVVIDHAVLHASTPNGTDRLRPVLGVFVKPVEANLVHYHLVDDGSMDVYQPPDGDWLLDLDPVLGPQDLEVVGRTAPVGAAASPAVP